MALVIGFFSDGLSGFLHLIFSVVFQGADFRVQERSKTNSCRSEGGVQVIEPTDRIIRTEPMPLG